MIYCIYSQRMTEYNLKGFDTMKRKLNVKNCFIALAYVVVFTVGFWFVASYIDVVTHNMPHHENYQEFAEWNFFVNFTDEVTAG